MPKKGERYEDDVQSLASACQDFTIASTAVAPLGGVRLGMGLLGFSARR
jgi:hypothetical protein